MDLWNGLVSYLDDHTVLPFVPQPLFAPLVPRMITHMARGNFDDVVKYLQTIGWDKPSTQNGLMALSMECSFNQPGVIRAKIAASAKALPTSIRSTVVANQVNGLAQCSTWHVPNIGAVNHTDFHSAIPTLLFSGRYDPRGSPAKTQALADTLGNADLVPVPSGHHPIEVGGCPDLITQAFLANPTQKPDTSCVAQMTVNWK
jgi:hypothetical protein